MKNRHKKTAVPNKVHFGIAVVYYYMIVQSAAQKARRKLFMLRKRQHRQVAPLAIQTPTEGGLCIGCAVLPAQRGLLGCRLGRCFCLRQRCPPDTRTPPRPPRSDLMVGERKKASADLCAEVFVYHS